MLNERDGGIGGVKLVIEECETGYDTKKGVECYEAVKGKNPVVVNPWSTGITLQLIPQGARSTRSRSCRWPTASRPSADGNDLPVGLQPAGRPIGTAPRSSSSTSPTKEGGLDKLKGKKIGLIHLDAPFGKEPIPLLENARQGVRLRAEALSRSPPHEMQNQGSHWLAHPPRPSGLDLHPGLGRDEPDRRQGGGQEQLPDGQARRRLVGRRRRRRARRRRRRQGLQDRSTSTRPAPTSRSSRTSSSTSSTRARAPRRRRRSARTSTTAASTTRC